MQCPVCKTQGSNMFKCSKCGRYYCRTCTNRGTAPYPKAKAGNICPYCGAYNASVSCQFENTKLTLQDITP